MRSTTPGFRKVLQADYAGSASPADTIPYELEAHAGQLGDAARQAHSRIADAYLSRFGGLDRELSVLAGAAARRRG